MVAHLKLKAAYGLQTANGLVLFSQVLLNKPTTTAFWTSKSKELFMADKNRVDPSKEKKPPNPWNWVLGSEFILAIIVLALSAAGYIILK